MKPGTLDKLEKHFAQSPVLRGSSATGLAIRQAEQRIGCRFTEDYKEFLSLFGCGIVGPNPIYGIGIAPAMARDEDVVGQTEWFRAKRWPFIEGWYIISTDGRGNPIGIDANKEVRLSDHDVGDVPIIAEDFEAFLLTRLKP